MSYYPESRTKTKERHRSSRWLCWWEVYIERHDFLCCQMYQICEMYIWSFLGKYKWLDQPDLLHLALQRRLLQCQKWRRFRQGTDPLGKVGLEIKVRSGFKSKFTFWVTRLWDHGQKIQSMTLGSLIGSWIGQWVGFWIESWVASWME